jgi:hypothetical protein
MKKLRQWYRNLFPLKWKHTFHIVHLSCNGRILDVPYVLSTKGDEMAIKWLDIPDKYVDVVFK